jgi:hypothetical protein
VSARCAEPLGLPVLVDYWFGGLDGSEEERVEEHVLGCAACSESLRWLAEAGEGVRRLARQGAFAVVVGPSFLDAASRQGLRIREYAVPPGGRVACTVAAEDDLLVSRLQGDFRDVPRVDLLVEVQGRPEQRALDLPVAPSSSEVILVQAMPALRALPSGIIRMRLLAPEPEGDRVLGEYMFDHTRQDG